MGKYLIVLVAMFVGLIAFVSGDTALINTVCGKTANAGSCHRCYNKYTRSSHEDLKALGRTGIDCASSQSQLLISDVIYLEGNAKGKERNAYIDCSTKLKSGEKQIANALQSWQSGHYADAGNQLLAAMQTARDCASGVKGSNPPPSLGDDLTALEGFCQAADGVLKQIH
jgi:pectinesterase inhibitor-like protein